MHGEKDPGARAKERLREAGSVTLLAFLLFGLSFSAVSAAGTVRVLYAGSLVALMEEELGPAFTTASGERFAGYPGGSTLLANEIKARLRPADIFISANPKVNPRLEGKANGNWVRWYVAFARSPLVIGYNPKSRFAGDFQSKPWYDVLEEPGLRLGRTDPKLDPKGAHTLELMDKAEAYYKMPGLARRILGNPENPAQVLPEETLIGRLQSGELDAGFFYSIETAKAHIPAIALPAALTLGAEYTVAILRSSLNPQGALRFVAFLLGPEGRRLMERHGLAVQKPALFGRAPAAISALVKKAQ